MSDRTQATYFGHELSLAILTTRPQFFRGIVLSGSRVRRRATKIVLSAKKRAADRGALSLASSTLLADLVAGGKLRIVPAIHALDTGEVSYL